MYAPNAFAEREPARLRALLAAHAFAVLVTPGEDGPEASHVPLLLDAARGPHGTLLGHLARANPRWQRLDGRTPALAVFAGPHAYVSPRWYGGDRNVPTWDYVAVHARGAPRRLDDEARVRDVLRRTMA